jgi:hypothetical protein
MKVTVGCDPELFLKRGNEYIAAVGLVPGTKAKPHKLNKGAVQRDGLALEFNIDPAATSADFTSNTGTVLDQCRNLVPAGVVLDPKPVVIFDPKYYESLPEDSKQLGCDPDFNAISMQRNTNPQAFGSMRTGAGHLHLGWTEGASPFDKGHFYDCCTLVRKIDQYFSVFKRFWDTDEVRQRMYGAQGAFRPKPYGLEYRVLSNAWLCEPKLWPWLFDSMKWVFDITTTKNPKWDQYHWPRSIGYEFTMGTLSHRKESIDRDMVLFFGTSDYPKFPLPERIAAYGRR